MDKETEKKDVASMYEQRKQQALFKGPRFDPWHTLSC